MSSFELVSTHTPRGDQPAAIGTLVSALEEGPDTRSCWGHRFRKDLHHGQCDRTTLARSGIGPQQNARWAIVCWLKRSFLIMRSIFRQLLRLLPTGSVRSVDGHLHPEGCKGE